MSGRFLCQIDLEMSKGSSKWSQECNRDPGVRRRSCLCLDVDQLEQAKNPLELKDIKSSK